MKILCRTQIVARNAPQMRPLRAAKATLAIGVTPAARGSGGAPKKPELQVVLFTPQNRTGHRYRVLYNVDKLYTKYARDGKATISFLVPPEDLMVSCDPLELQNFLQVLRLGIEGKHDPTLKTNIAAATAIAPKSHPIEKMVIVRPRDYPTRGFPSTLKTLTLSGLDLCRLAASVCDLVNLTSLNLENNHLTRLPAGLGNLGLRDVHLAHNTLGKENNWQWLAGATIRSTLVSLDLSNNGIWKLPACLTRCTKLLTLKLSDNLLSNLPYAMAYMENLRYLHIASNKFVSLPSFVNDMTLELLDVWGNSFAEATEYDLKDYAWLREVVQPSSLQLLAAQAVVTHRIRVQDGDLTPPLYDFIRESPRCVCGKLCPMEHLWSCAAMATLEYVRRVVLNRDRSIYMDIVLCSPTCKGKMQLALGPGAFPIGYGLFRYFSYQEEFILACSEHWEYTDEGYVAAILALPPSTYIRIKIGRRPATLRASLLDQMYQERAKRNQK